MSPPESSALGRWGGRLLLAVLLLYLLLYFLGTVEDLFRLGWF